ncbi:MAG TPA: hypothetical protein VGK58_00590 [Lacipirellulaceae bacterium]
MGRSSTRFVFAFCVGALVMAAAGSACTAADWAEGHGDRSRAPVYRRHAFDRMPRHGGQHGRGYYRGRVPTPQVSAGWFQRPYPYHLDYYRMRYGGSYAPYFGNLYGPPQVVTAPPYYGPYYGGYDAPNGYYPPAYENGAADEQSAHHPAGSQPETDELNDDLPQPALPQ